MIASYIRSWTKKEWKWIWLVSATLIFISLAPLLYGYFVTPSDFVFLWIQNLSPGDNSIYYSLINQAKEGHVLFKSYTTLLDGPRYVFNLVWVCVGAFASFFSLSEAIAFHIVRLILIPFAVLSAYIFVSVFFKEIKWRFFAFILLCFSGGIGSAYAILFDASFEYSTQVGYYHWPMDLWVSESHFFLSLYRSPHFILSMILMIFIHLYLYFAFTKEHIKYIWIAGVLGCILISFHPYHVPTFFTILTLFGFFLLLRDRKIHWRFFGYCTLFFLLLSPSIVYYVWLMKADILKALHAAANITLTTQLHLTVISFGVPLFLGILGFFCILLQKKYINSYMYLYAWFIGNFIAMYLPLAFQRRLTQGFQFPMIILAVVGSMFLYQKYKRFFDEFLHMKFLVLLLFIYLFASSSCSVFIRDFVIYTNSTILSWDKDSYIGMQWMKENARESNVLATYMDRSYLSSFAPIYSYVAHAHETPFARANLDFSDWFFLTNNSDEHKRKFLSSENIEYIFYNTSNLQRYIEMEFDNSLEIQEIFDADRKDYLKEVYRHNDLVIYKVLK